MAANQDGNCSADISFDSVGNASIDSGALADISSAERASVSSANSVEPETTQWSVTSEKTSQAPSPAMEGHWKFIQGGKSYVGKFVGCIESVKGVKLKLQFANGSDFAKLRDDCVKTTKPLSANRPSGQS